MRVMVLHGGGVALDAIVDRHVRASTGAVQAVRR
jgi:hypothetical protein